MCEMGSWTGSSPKSSPTLGFYAHSYLKTMSDILLPIKLKMFKEVPTLEALCDLALLWTECLCLPKIHRLQF